MAIGHAEERAQRTVRCLTGHFLPLGPLKRRPDFVAAGDALPVGARARRSGATAVAGAGGGHLDGWVGAAGVRLRITRRRRRTIGRLAVR